MPAHSSRETDVYRGNKTGQTNMDFLGFASGLSCSARAKIETKAIKASAGYTFSNQDHGIHCPSLECGLHGNTDSRRLA